MSSLLTLLITKIIMRSGDSREEIFNTIYETNHWDSEESVSGPGGELRQTESLCRKLPLFFEKYDIKSMLDIPCGDFNWMQHVDMSYLERYIGADIVQDLVEEVLEQYSNGKRTFMQLDIVEDELAEADLIFTRDCFVHLSNDEVLKALDNVAETEADYFLTTTYRNLDENKDTSQGEWRPINLEEEPFNLPPFIDYINTDFQDGGRNFPGNGMGLWSIEDIT